MIIKIGQIPKTPHLLADLVELCLLFDGYYEISRSDVWEIINIENRDDSKMSSAEHNGKIQTDIEDCFIQLQYRINAFGSCYPFELDNHVLYCKDYVNEQHALYIFLLMCSRLRSLPKINPQKFAYLFEKVCKEALKNLMPASAQVRIFGANSEDRQKYYGTDLRKALKKLGNDIQAIISSEELIDEQSSSGDCGLDLVGYIPFNDKAKGSLVIFGQCAAREKDWPKKTLEAHPTRFVCYRFFHDPMNVVFILVPTLQRWNADGTLQRPFYRSNAELRSNAKV